MEFSSVRTGIINIQVPAKFKLILRMVRCLICFSVVQFLLLGAKRILLIRTRASRCRSTQRFSTCSKKSMEADRQTTSKQDSANTEGFTKYYKMSCLATSANYLMIASLLWKTNMKKGYRAFPPCLSHLTRNQSGNNLSCKGSKAKIKVCLAVQAVLYLNLLKIDFINN